MADINKLLDIMSALREPTTGCPWDLEQSYKSIAPYTLEEAYEVVDAIERDALDELPGELGDLLFQVAFYAQLAKEEGRFEFKDVVQAICEKMVRRHPHVFDTAERGDAAGQIERWEDIKAQERGNEARISVLDGIPVGMPAMFRAAKLGSRAKRVGFDWPECAGVLNKLDEERQELGAALDANDQDAIEDELGDLLFTAVQLARHKGIDADQALRRANAKFERRFRAMELNSDDALSEQDAASLEAAWARAKAADPE